MQEYDESFFITKANKRGGVTWFILMIIVSVYYGIKVGTGKLDVGYFFMFFTVGWLSFMLLCMHKYGNKASCRVRWSIDSFD